MAEAAGKIDDFKVDDRLVRWIGIPFFGLVIPSASGLVSLTGNPLYAVALSFGYYILLAFIIWEGNRYLLFKNYPTIFKSQSVVQKYTLMLGLNLFYTIPVSAVALYGWGWGTKSPITHGVVWLTILIIVVCVIFVTNVYEKVLLVRQSEREILKSEQLERAKAMAELEALKNQIDPHFMFNALNSLSYLIDADSRKAQQFVDNLAEVYRYILKCKDKDLVLLHDEMTFMNAYVSLLRLRHENAFQVDMQLDSDTASAYLVPPVSMMVAVENAVKHNELSSRNQLVLSITKSGNKLSISNRISLRKSVKNSTKTGLKNLDERFQRIMGEGIEICNEGGSFCLHLPILKVSDI